MSLEQMKIRLERLLDDKEELTREFHSVTGAGERQLIHEDIVAINESIDHLTDRIETQEEFLVANPPANPPPAPENGQPLTAGEIAALKQVADGKQLDYPMWQALSDKGLIVVTHDQKYNRKDELTIGGRAVLAQAAGEKPESEVITARQFTLRHMKELIAAGKVKVTWNGLRGVDHWIITDIITETTYSWRVQCRSDHFKEEHDEYYWAFESDTFTVTWLPATAQAVPSVLDRIADLPPEQRSEFVHLYNDPKAFAEALAKKHLDMLKNAVDEVMTAQPVTVGGEFPTVVCLCGSTRFSEAFQQANFSETLAGRIVLTIGCDMKSDNELFKNMSEDELTEVKTRLDKLHFQKIELADEVLILNVGQYIGESTKRELAYAKSLNKGIRYLEALAGGQPDNGANGEATG